MDAITEGLLDNSKSAILSCIELHNKPNFAYRYEVCTILAINGWELILKAYINEHLKNIKLLRKDGTTLPFESCVINVSDKIGKEFKQTEENLKAVYKYRCEYIHFYKDNLDPIIHSLLHTSILLYNDFSKKQFNIDISESSNLVLLPIGFQPIISPIDFLSNKSRIKNSSLFVQNFIESIIVSTNKLIDEDIPYSIFSTFNISAINENRVKNADIIAGITKDPNASKLSISQIFNANITNDEDARKIKIEEDSIFHTYYTLNYQDVVNQCRLMYTNFKQNGSFNRLMSNIKTNPNLHRKRYLDPSNKTGVGKDFYSTKIFEELDKHYIKRL